jgi:hypothetical protein
MLALGVVLTIGLLLRLALLYRIPPLFMPGDSQSFLTPAYDLARGLGFDPILKRPLGYPLLVAAAISLLGEDLRGLVFVQTMLGLVTVAATYWVGRLVFGRLTGLLASLSVAIGGQLLIYEHYILAESVFGMFVVLAVLALVLAARRECHAWRWAAAGGVALGFASLFRPIAEVLVPLIPVYFLVLVRPRRQALTMTGIALAGLMLTMGPALLADLALRGGVSSGALGEHLLWRITRSDSGYIRRADIPPGEPDSPPAKYISSTLWFSVELFFGADQQLGDVSKRDGEAGYINPQARQRTWFEDRILHLGEPPAPAVENEFNRAEALTSIYQPGRIWWLIGVGFVLGCVAVVVSRERRAGLLLVWGIPPMLLANAALAGPEARFRYPIDPLIAVLAFGGLVWVASLAWHRLGRPRTA